MQIFSAMDTYFQSLGTLGLALNAFIESFFLVPPPDFLLIAMDLAKPERALYYALICTIASAFGGVVGYWIGKFGGRPVFIWILTALSRKKDGVQKRKQLKNALQKFNEVETLYNKWGVQAVFFAAFTPIPYKVFTIASGILNMNLVAFTLSSIIGRGMRFFIVSIVLMLFGEKIKDHLELIILGATLVIVVFFIILYKKRHSISKKVK